MPTLKPDDIVVMDNLAHTSGPNRHRNRGGRRPAALPAALFARPQPDRNGLRQAQGRPSQGGRRSIEALLDAIAVALAAFTAQECMNFFAAAGYDRV